MASRSIKNRPGTKKKQPKIGFLAVLAVLIAIVVSCGVGVYALGSSWIGDLTEYDVDDVSSLNAAEPSMVYASDETTELARFQLEFREPVELDQISQYVLEGTVATEDERFYEHGGFDLMGIARALVVNITGSGREGASTITQQFVRNTILSDEMDEISLKRKVREMYLSVKLEESYSKDEILLMYLNTINYGSGAYGIEAAAQRYFSKSAADLTLAEAATLIGIPQSPTYNNPLDEGNGERALARRNLVLGRMLKNNYISQEEHDAAVAQDIELATTEPSVTGILKYPFFTSYVRDLLQNQYGLSRDEIFKGGHKIYTTLDPAIQDAAEAAVDKKESEVDAALSGALIAIEPTTGYIKAIVGGKDFEANQVNLATGTGGSGRQAGSAFKTFTLVAALEQGISPTTLVDAGSRASFGTWDVENINGNNYGTIPISKAFAKSSNTAFARIIMSIGPEKVVDTAHRMGIQSNLEAVGSLTLGTSEVTPLEMASAYATIANGGTYYRPTAILTVEDRNGTVIYDETDPEARATHNVISPEVAHAASEVMKGVVDSYDGTGQEARLSSGQVVAGKTGTTENYKDIWFCGITPQLSVATWLGDPDNQAKVPFDQGVDDMFRDFMEVALADQPRQDFPMAADPAYKSYSDSKYHIGGYGGSSSNSSNSNKEEDDASEAAPPASAGSANGATSGGSSTGGGDAGGGGSTSGGDTGGTTGGGTSGGGDTGGGSTGGGDTGGGTTGGGSTGGGDTGGSTGGGDTGGGSTGGGTPEGGGSGGSETPTP